MAKNFCTVARTFSKHFGSANGMKILACSRSICARVVSTIIDPSLSIIIQIGVLLTVIIGLSSGLSSKTPHGVTVVVRTVTGMLDSSINLRNDSVISLTVVTE